MAGMYIPQAVLNQEGLLRDVDTVRVSQCDRPSHRTTMYPSPTAAYFPSSSPHKPPHRGESQPPRGTHRSSTSSTATATPWSCTLAEGLWRSVSGGRGGLRPPRFGGAPTGWLAPRTRTGWRTVWTCTRSAWTTW